MVSFVGLNVVKVVDVVAKTKVVITRKRKAATVDLGEKTEVSSLSIAPAAPKTELNKRLLHQRAERSFRH